MVPLQIKNRERIIQEDMRALYLSAQHWQHVYNDIVEYEGYSARITDDCYIHIINNEKKCIHAINIGATACNCCTLAHERSKQKDIWLCIGRGKICDTCPITVYGEKYCGHVESYWKRIVDVFTTYNSINSGHINVVFAMYTMLNRLWLLLQDKRAEYIMTTEDVAEKSTNGANGVYAKHFRTLSSTDYPPKNVPVMLKRISNEGVITTKIVVFCEHYQAVILWEDTCDFETSILYSDDYLTMQQSGDRTVKKICRAIFFPPMILDMAKANSVTWQWCPIF